LAFLRQVVAQLLAAGGREVGRHGEDLLAVVLVAVAGPAVQLLPDHQREGIDVGLRHLPRMDDRPLREVRWDVQVHRRRGTAQAIDGKQGEQEQRRDDRPLHADQQFGIVQRVQKA